MVFLLVAQIRNYHSTDGVTSAGGETSTVKLSKFSEQANIIYMYIYILHRLENKHVANAS